MDGEKKGKRNRIDAKDTTMCWICDKEIKGNGEQMGEQVATKSMFTWEKKLSIELHVYISTSCEQRRIKKNIFEMCAPCCSYK